jgi:peptidoglycan hydrolase-like protein with peptidoglycan-binding domain
MTQLQSFDLGPRNLVRFSAIILLVFVFGQSVFGDEATRRAQEELRKRNLYFGDVNGQMNPELTNALKKFQARKGFEVSGQIDKDTASSLNIPQSPAEVAASTTWPDVPILKSDAARELPEPERVALEQQAEASGGANSTAIAAPAESPTSSQNLKPEEITKFVKDYLRDAETDDVDLQLGYFAFPVDYFDHGKVGRDFVAKDTRNYVRRWPQRKYMLTGPVKFLASSRPDDTRLEFVIAFSVGDIKHAVHGKTKNYWTVTFHGENLKIVAVREQRLHD